MAKFKGGNAKFTGSDGKEHNVTASETGELKIDNNSINVKFVSNSKSYLCTEKNKVLGTIAQLGNIPEFCKKFFSENLVNA